MVGREEEWQAIGRPCAKQRYAQAGPHGRHLGDAGIGKSRQSPELTRRRGQARLVRGRCLAYGEGITFWPLREMAARPPIRHDDTPEDGHEKLAARAGDRRRRCPDRRRPPASARPVFPLQKTTGGRASFTRRWPSNGPLVGAGSTTSTGPSPAFLDLLETCSTPPRPPDPAALHVAP